MNHVLPAAKLGNGGLILVLVGTPSGFAIFSYDGIKLLQPNACQVSFQYDLLMCSLPLVVGVMFQYSLCVQDIWVDFADLTVAKRVSSSFSSWF